MRAEDWDRRWREKALHVHGEPSAIVLSALAGVEAGRALDVGCGSGRHAVWLAERGFHVTGVDFSAEALRQAGEHAADAGVEVDWVQEDVRAFEPEPGAFELVLVAYVHLPPDERRTVLRRATAAVAPGGTFLLVGHDSRNIDAGAPGPREPSVLYTADDIVPELSGLEIRDADTVRRVVALAGGGTAEAVDAVVLARRPS